MQLPPRPRLLVAGVAILVLAAAALGGVVILGSPEPTPMPTPTASPSPTPSPTPSPSPSPSPSPTPEPTPVAVCPLNGLPVDDPAVLDGPAFLVQVENNPIGRPTSGLNAADLVIEAPVEGDTTRFGPVYLCSEPPAAVGPVRSARYYNTDLWRELHAITVHFGAGFAVLHQFDTTGTPYTNGIAGGWPFLERRGPLPAPHNVFFDLSIARQFAEENRLGNREERAGVPRAPFTFAADALDELPDGRRVASVRIYTNSFWNFGWRWDADAAVWLRSDDGVRATDALTGEALNAKTVVVQLVTQTILHGELDPGGYPRRRQHLVGTGNGIVYVNGQAHDVRWARDSNDAQTVFTFADSGEPLVLPPGRVWWEILPVGSSITEN